MKTLSGKLYERNKNAFVKKIQLQVLPGTRLMIAVVMVSDCTKTHSKSNKVQWTKDEEYTVIDGKEQENNTHIMFNGEVN